MKKIIYQKEKIDLALSVATILRNVNENTSSYTIGIDTAELMGVVEACEQIKLEEDELVDSNSKIILIGIHPRNHREGLIVLDFLEKYGDQVELWIDEAIWPAGLAKYVSQSSRRIFISQEESCLAILKNLGYRFPLAWLKAEKAIKARDASNRLAQRYLIADLMNQNIKTVFQQQKDEYENFLFASMVDELYLERKNEAIEMLVQEFPFFYVETKKAKRKLDGNYHLFTKARKAGRPIGYFQLGEVRNIINYSEIIDYGLNFYPWLCILEAQIDGDTVIIIKSAKVAIDEILGMYSEHDLEKKETFKVLEAEIIKWKE